MTKKIMWSAELLDNGAEKTQAEWVQWCKDTGTGVRLPFVKEYESLVSWPDSDFKTKLRADLQSCWLMTGDVLKNPFTGDERPVVLGLLGGFNRFFIDAGNVDDVGPARGVIEVEE